MRLFKTQRGFTLLEVIAALLIIGIAAAVAGMGVVNGVRSFLFVRTNNEIIQKSQVALNRIKLELMSMDRITAYSATSITFESKGTERNPGSDTATYTITQAGTQLTMTVTGGVPYVLMDNVGTYGGGETFLSFCSDSLCTGQWTTIGDLSGLAAVRVILPVSRADGVGDMKFTTYVNPRRNGLPLAPRYKL